MSTILRKEMRLSALLLTYLFIGFAATTLIPSYPALCGVFFITLGIFQSFQSAREANDIIYCALLPIAKKDVVKGKYLFTVFIELCGFAIMAVLTVLRMTVFCDSPVYRVNKLMNTNLFFLCMALFIFGLFNVIFVGGFFKTAYQIGKHFVIYIVVCFIVIGFSEALHYMPGLSALNSFGFDNFGLQLMLLTAGVILYIVMTLLSYKKSCDNFEKIDL